MLLKNTLAIIFGKFSVSFRKIITGKYLLEIYCEHSRLLAGVLSIAQ